MTLETIAPLSMIHSSDGVIGVGPELK